MSLTPLTKSSATPERQSSRLPKYLHRRGRNYYFKRRIPTDVEDGFPDFKGQVWKSLNTDNLTQARLYLAVELSEFDLTVAALRRTRAQEQAQRSPIAATVVPFSLVRRASDKTDTSSEEVDKPSEQAVEANSHLPVLLISGSDSSAEDSVKRTAERPPISTDIAAVGTGTQRESSDDSTLIAPTMTHLFESWKRKQERQRSINAVHTALMEFRTVHGPIPVEAIERRHARIYRDWLIERGLCKRTIENRLGFLSTLMRHGMREIVEHLSLNPFEYIDVVGATGLRQPKDRRAYRVSELNCIYAGNLYTAGYRPAGQSVDAAYWLPILGPFVGARIEELCQMRIEDVQRVNGVWCLRLCDLDVNQELKNPNSFRRVPLHEVVIKSGFLLYAAQMANAGHERVFPTLTNDNTNGIYSNAVGKWYGRYLESIGLTDHRLDYHSYRYTFRQQCSLCGVDNEVRDALTGHWVGKSDSGRTYMKGENNQYSFPKLVEAIQQLRYDELKVAHLFVENPLEGVEAALLK
jgi:integrase